ncbi:MAG: DUF4956 domain-containing protein [Phycisphaerales bacterium]
MPDWLTSAVHPDEPLSATTLAVRLLLALLAGAGVAIIYRLAHGRETRDSRTLATTLVLLTVLIAMVTLVIGNSVARAFSLVGALSIVRFRTIVEDTRDTAFVIFAVIVGMAMGTSLVLVPLIGMPIVGCAAILMSRLPQPGGVAVNGRCTVAVRVGFGGDFDATLRAALATHLDGVRLIGTETARQGAALQLTYVGQLRTSDAQVAVVSSLNQIEGVQSVELRLS